MGDRREFSDLFRERLDVLEKAVAEQQRMIATLRYYIWLEDHGVSRPWTKGITVSRIAARKRYPTGAEWSKVPREIRNRFPPRVRKPVITYRFKDGSELVLPWPPFDDEIIFGTKKEG